MCNDYEQHILYAEYCQMMQKLALEIPPHQSELDLPRADDIKVGDTGPVMRAASPGVVELSPMRFGFPPPTEEKAGLSSIFAPMDGTSETASVV